MSNNVDSDQPTEPVNVFVFVNESDRGSNCEFGRSNVTRIVPDGPSFDSVKIAVSVIGFVAVSAFDEAIFRVPKNPNDLKTAVNENDFEDVNDRDGENGGDDVNPDDGLKAGLGEKGEDRVNGLDGEAVGVSQTAGQKCVLQTQSLRFVGTTPVSQSVNDAELVGGEPEKRQRRKT
jgi:hypothetical protein